MNKKLSIILSLLCVLLLLGNFMMLRRTVEQNRYYIRGVYSGLVNLLILLEGVSAETAEDDLSYYYQKFEITCSQLDSAIDGLNVVSRGEYAFSSFGGYNHLLFGTGFDRELVNAYAARVESLLMELSADRTIQFESRTPNQALSARRVKALINESFDSSTFRTER